MANDRAGVSHTSPICGVAYSSEFKQVISGDNEGTVQVWDVENGTMTFKFNRTHGHDNKLTNLCLDPSGRRIVTCGDDGLAKIWNFSNGQCLRKCLSNGNKELSSVEFVVSGPNVFLLSGGWDKRIFVYPDIHDRPVQQYTRCLPALDMPGIQQKDIVAGVGGEGGEGGGGGGNGGINEPHHNHHYARIKESHKRLLQHQHYLMMRSQRQETSNVDVKLVAKKRRSLKSGFGRGFTALRPNSAAVVRRRRQNEYSASRRNLTTNPQRKRPMSASVVRSRSKPRQHPLQSFGQNRPAVRQVVRPATCNNQSMQSMQQQQEQQQPTRPATTAGHRRPHSRVHFAVQMVEDVAANEDKNKHQRVQNSVGGPQHQQHQQRQEQRPATAGVGRRTRRTRRNGGHGGHQTLQQRTKWFQEGQRGEHTALPVHGARPSSAAPAAPGMRRTRYHSDRAYSAHRRPTIVSHTIATSSTALNHSSTGSTTTSTTSTTSSSTGSSSSSRSSVSSLASAASGRRLVAEGILLRPHETGKNNQYPQNHQKNGNNANDYIENQEDITQIPRRLSTSTSSQMAFDNATSMHAGRGNTSGNTSGNAVQRSGHTDDITVIRYCKGANTVVTGSHDGYIIFWNLETGSQKYRLCTYDEDTRAGRSGTTRASKSADPSRVKSVLSLTSVELNTSVCVLISSGMSNVIKLWDLKHGVLMSSLTTNHNPNEWISSVAHHTPAPSVYGSSCSSSDLINDVIVTGSTDGTIRIWDFKHDLLKTSTKTSNAKFSSLFSGRDTSFASFSSAVAGAAGSAGAVGAAGASPASSAFYSTEQDQNGTNIDGGFNDQDNGTGHNKATGGLGPVAMKRIASTFGRMSCLCGWNAHREGVNTLQIVQVNESNMGNGGGNNNDADDADALTHPALRQNIRGSVLKRSLIGEGTRFLISSSYDQTIIIWDLSGHRVGTVFLCCCFRYKCL